MGLYSMTMIELANSLDQDAVVVKKGTRKPGGKLTIGQLIIKYDLDKEEFYETIHLPMDYPEDEKIIILVRNGDISYADINAYMSPIMDEYYKK